MNTIASLVLVGWVPLSLVAFAFLSPRRAGLVVMASGWMFVPIHSIATPGLPDITKSMSVSLAVAAGVLCFDHRRIFTLRLHWLDLVTATWLVAPAFASFANNLGAYDALSAVLQRSISWGVPYLFGRLYLTSNAALRDCLWVLFLSGLIYAPFALYEVRMSPQLHRIVYGAAQHNFLQTIRGGGYRPMVFMHHGLELSMWLSWSSIAGLSLWRFLGVRRVLGVPMALACAGLLGTVLLCKSSGALALLGLTIVMMAPRSSRWLRGLVLFGVPAFLLVRTFSDGVVERQVVEW
ncbi:MAG: O-antigen ligase domain-containing protein, partial [Planctomycetota bacterium]